VRLFLDSSALMKRYIPERGTEQVIAACAEADEVLLSILAAPEVVSAFNRLRREGHITHEEYRSLKQRLLADVAHATVIEYSLAVLTGTFACLEQSPLRASDAIHLASVLETNPDRFLTGDRRQFQAAKALGLNVEGVALDEQPAGAPRG